MVEQQTTLTCDQCGEAETVETTPGQAFTPPTGWVVVVIPPAYNRQLAFNRVECITGYAQAHGFAEAAPEAPVEAPEELPPAEEPAEAAPVPDPVAVGPILPPEEPAPAPEDVPPPDDPFAVDDVPPEEPAEPAP